MAALLDLAAAGRQYIGEKDNELLWANSRSGLCLISYRGASSAAISLRHQREYLGPRAVASLPVIAPHRIDPRFSDQKKITEIYRR